MIKYPIGIQSFEQLREDGYVYVDMNNCAKTVMYMLTRPH